MLHIMNKLEFHERFISLINKSINLKQELISTIYKITNNNVKPKEIINLLENKYDYPSLQTVHESIIRSRNKLLQKEIKILKKENKVLERKNFCKLNYHQNN